MKVHVVGNVHFVETTDTAKVSDTTITEEEWVDATNAHERFKALLETKPRAKARYGTVLAEINSR